jgi:hypothetical protein
MTNPAWKRTERRIAAILGGRRVPITGRQRGDVPDVSHPLWSVEVKHRQTLPGWLCAAVEQSQAAAMPGQIPIAVIHEHGRPYAAALVVMTLDQFMQHNATENTAAIGRSEVCRPGDQLDQRSGRRMHPR